MEVGTELKASSTYLQFFLGKKLYAIDIECVTEIIEVQKVTEVPDMESYVEGVINLRGNIITLVDICQRLGVIKDEDERGCVIIVSVNDKKYGLIVDNVDAVINIDAKDIEVPGGLDVSRSMTMGTAKKNKELCIVLDTKRLI